MADRTWKFRDVDPAQVQALEQDLGLDPVVARILVARGVGEEEQARRFMEPRLSQLTPPDSMAGMNAAADRVARAVEQREQVGVFGDYDVDGVTSTALVGGYLRGCGLRPVLRVARRDEGYGFSAVHAEEVAGKGCTLLVLVDCGTSDVTAVSRANELGLDVVALDHHQVNGTIWPGLSLVNPQRPDCGFAFKGLTSVGLCFYLTACLRRKLEALGLRAPDPRTGLDLVALGTVADVAPLTDLNRVLVSRGLVQLNHTRRPGLRELLRLCNLESGVPRSDEVGWKLCPRLNAPGRMGDAAQALACLWESNPARAVQAARECCRLNDLRREIQDAVMDSAMEMGRRQAEAGRRFLLVASPGWHPGIIGIVASRLVDTFNLPGAVVTVDGDQCKGSARGVNGIDLVAVLGGASSLLTRFGGHCAAAGFSLKAENLEALGRRLHELCLDRPGVERTLWVDGEVDLGRVDLDLCNKIRKLQPFGEGNPEPLLATDNVRVEDAREVGDGHLKMDVRHRGHTREVIGFRMADQLPEPGQHLDLAFVPEINTFRGLRVQLRLADLRHTKD